MDKYKGRTPGELQLELAHELEIMTRAYEQSELVSKGLGEDAATLTGIIDKREKECDVLAGKVETLKERVACLVLALDGSDKAKDKLAKQNAKMLAFLKSDCADCKAASQATKAQCALCENGKIIAEIEG